MYRSRSKKTLVDHVQRSLRLHSQRALSTNKNLPGKHYRPSPQSAHQSPPAIPPAAANNAKVISTPVSKSNDVVGHTPPAPPSTPIAGGNLPPPRKDAGGWVLPFAVLATFGTGLFYLKQNPEKAPAFLRERLAPSSISPSSSPSPISGQAPAKTQTAPSTEENSKPKVTGRDDTTNEPAKVRKSSGKLKTEEEKQLHNPSSGPGAAIAEQMVNKKPDEKTGDKKVVEEKKPEDRIVEEKKSIAKNSEKPGESKQLDTKSNAKKVSEKPKENKQPESKSRAENPDKSTPKKSSSAEIAGASKIIESILPEDGEEDEVEDGPNKSPLTKDKPKSKPVDNQAKSEEVPKKAQPNKSGKNEALKAEREALEKLKLQLHGLEAVAAQEHTETLKRTADALHAEAAAIGRDLESGVLADLPSLGVDELRLKVKELTMEMKNRTKWEAVRLIESLRRVEQELANKNSDMLKHQQEMHEEILRRELRHQEEILTHKLKEDRDSLEADLKSHFDYELQHKESQIQAKYEGSYKSKIEKLENEHKSKIAKLEEDYQSKLLQETNKKLKELEELKLHMNALDSVLDNTSSYELFSHQVHKVSVAALALANKLETSLPLGDELSSLRDAGKGDFVIEAVLDTIPAPVANGGVSTVQQMQKRFASVRRATRTAALVPEGTGIVGHAFGQFLSFLVIPASGPIEGDDVEAVLSRASYHLERGNLAGASRELESIKGYPAEVLSDFLKEVKSRIATEQAIGVVKAHVALLAASCA